MERQLGGQINTHDFRWNSRVLRHI